MKTLTTVAHSPMACLEVLHNLAAYLRQNAANFVPAVVSDMREFCRIKADDIFSVPVHYQLQSRYSSSLFILSSCDFTAEPHNRLAIFTP